MAKSSMLNEFNVVTNTEASAKPRWQEQHANKFKVVTNTNAYPKP